MKQSNKLNKKDIKKINKLYNSGASRKDLAEKFNVTIPTIWYHTHKKSSKENMRYTGIGKKTIRNHMLWLCNREYKKNTLTAIIEFFGAGELFNHLLKNTQAKITSIDNNDKIGKKLKDIPFTRYASYQTMCQEKNLYNIHFLDYCGDMTTDVEKDIAKAHNIMMDESILCITLCMRTGKFPQNTSRETMESNYIETVIRILAEKNITAKLNFVVKYSGERIDPITEKINKKYPMKFYQFTCKRVKDNIGKSIDEMSGKEAKTALKEYLTRPKFITPEELKLIDETEQKFLSKIK